MSISQVNQGLLEYTVKNAIMNAICADYYCIMSSPIVLTPHRSCVNLEECAMRNYDTAEGLYNGGVLVSAAGDLLFIHCGKHDDGVIKLFCESLSQWLRSLGLNSVISGNDVLVDDYKVCGTTITRHGYIDFGGAFVAMSVNLDDIRALCKKPMVKTPRGLSEYGITTDELQKWFEYFVHNNLDLI